MHSNTSTHRLSLFSHRKGMKKVAALGDAARECWLKGETGLAVQGVEEQHGECNSRRKEQPAEELSHSSAKMAVPLRRGLWSTSYVVGAACDFIRESKSRGSRRHGEDPQDGGKEEEGSGNISKGSPSLGCQREDGEHEFPPKARQEGASQKNGRPALPNIGKRLRRRGGELRCSQRLCQ